MKEIPYTFEEISEDMDGSEIFSKLDLRMGYHQLELDEESLHLAQQLRWLVKKGKQIPMWWKQRLCLGYPITKLIGPKNIRKLLSTW